MECIKINDLPLNELIVAVHLNDAVLDTFVRNNKEKALFLALAEIEFAARKAQERLNELRWKVRHEPSRGAVSG